MPRTFYGGSYSFGRNVGAHVAVVEKALGKRLPAGAIVHHADDNPSNNAPGNLVVCPSQQYHRLLHSRAEAYDACGNANWRKCQYCQTFDDPANMKQVQKGGRALMTCWHEGCRPSRAKGAANV